MNILVINCGSSSIKYQLIDTATEQSLKQGIVENIHAEQLAHHLQAVFKACEGETIHAVGHRIVHGGSFHQAQLLGDDVIDEIREYSHLAPLHNPYNLNGIEAAKKILPDVPQIGVFDTAFHARLPRRAANYAIDPTLAEQYKIRRYGFHGTSHSFVAEKAADFMQQPVSALRIISLHLGNGASACAIEYGHSTETSMGMTPLEGLVMGSRCGDIDPGIILLLMREANMSADQIDDLLNRESGLKGLSGISHDIREVERAAAEGNDRARLAIAVFVHQARKYIGAYAATMGGVDAIVLTGGIGENSSTIRRHLLQRLDFLGALLDDEKNQDACVNHENPVAAIHRYHSRIQLLAIKTNEELAIARQAASLLYKQKTTDTHRQIPVAVSARHVHLCEQTFAALFGEDTEPEHFRDLVQPGQYACKQTVSLIGPRGRIDHVRLLGPLRKQDQIEISRTDEFVLGVDAPVRDSGQTQGSAPITLEGPAGSVHLPEGLICAKRHIHMHTDDARRFGVQDGDEVEVAFTGSERKLVFGGVLIRVSPNFRLEMHIDTDEANAAELGNHSNAELVYSSTNKTRAVLRTGNE